MAAVCLLFGANSAFAQCGADGTQPCNPTPKKTMPTKKNNSNAASKKTKSQSKINNTISKNARKNPVESDASLRSKIVGEWEGAKGYGHIFSSDGTGNYSQGNGVCQRFKFSISRNVLYISPSWADESSRWCSIKKQSYKIGFNSNEELSMSSLEYKIPSRFTRIK